MNSGWGWREETSSRDHECLNKTLDYSNIWRWDVSLSWDWAGDTCKKISESRIVIIYYSKLLTIIIIINHLSICLSVQGDGRLELIPADRGQGQVHPGQVSSLSQGWLQKENEVHTLTFTPMGNLEVPFYLLCLSLCAVGESRKTHGEPLYYYYYLSSEACQWTNYYRLWF